MVIRNIIIDRAHMTSYIYHILILCRFANYLRVTRLGRPLELENYAIMRRSLRVDE